MVDDDKSDDEDFYDASNGDDDFQPRKKTSDNPDVYDLSMTGEHHPRSSKAKGQSVPTNVRPSTMIKSANSKPKMFQPTSGDEDRDSQRCGEARGSKPNRGVKRPAPATVRDQVPWMERNKTQKPAGVKPAQPSPDAIDLVSDSDEDDENGVGRSTVVGEVSQEVPVSKRHKKTELASESDEDEVTIIEPEEVERSQRERKGRVSPAAMEAPGVTVEAATTPEEASQEGRDDVDTIDTTTAMDPPLSMSPEVKEDGLEASMEPPSSAPPRQEPRWVRKVMSQGFKLLGDAQNLVPEIDNATDEDKEKQHRCKISINCGLYRACWCPVPETDWPEPVSGQIWPPMRLLMERIPANPSSASKPNPNLVAKFFELDSRWLFLDDMTGKAPHNLEGSFDGHLISMYGVSAATWRYLKDTTRSKDEVEIERKAKIAAKMAPSGDPSYFKQSVGEVLHWTRGWDREITEDMSAIQKIRIQSMPVWEWVPRKEEAKVRSEAVQEDPPGERDGIERNMADQEPVGEDTQALDSGAHGQGSEEEEEEEEATRRKLSSQQAAGGQMEFSQSQEY